MEREWIDHSGLPSQQKPGWSRLFKKKSVNKAPKRKANHCMNQICAQLLQDCQAGDRKAQYQLYQSCYPLLMSVCMRYMQDDLEARGMLNQGFLKIVTNLEKYREEVPFEAWIRRIMINTIIDNFRKNRKVKELIEHRDFASSPPPQTDRFDWNIADQQFDAEQIEALIRSLPPMSQKVFNLYAIDGYSHREVSEQLGISVGTSKWHLSSARKRLQEMLRNLSNNSATAI